MVDTTGCEPSCHPVSQYCDSYESKCLSCADVCLLDMSKPDTCHQKCPNFLGTVVIQKLNSINTLYMYLTVLVLLTSITLFLLSLYGGTKVWKHLIKPQCGKHSVSPANSITKFQPGHQAITMQSLQVNGRIANELPTPNSYEATYNSVKTTSTRLSPRVNKGHASDKRRIPSEDRVPNRVDGCYDNPAMSRAPSESPMRQPSSHRRQLPPITSTSASHAVSEADQHNQPFTISHSQVV